MAQTSESAAPPLAFERLAEIAVGATARIELCRVTDGPRKRELVVVKRLHPHIADDPQFVNMFRDEAWMTASLRNKHVVQVVGWGTDEGGPFLAVDFVRGVSLARLMKTIFETGELFTERMVVYLGACVCDGLAAAHSLRSPSGEHLSLVHRDITPGNVLLGFDGQVKIADFGLAKAKMRLTKTLTGLLKGQPHYMAPEQIRSQPLDGRTDVFALGVMLFELFSGRRPWNAASDLEAMRATVEDRPQPLERYRPKIDKALIAVVNKCLEKDPADRYQTADVLRDEFAKWLHAHGYREDNDIALARFVRRNAMRQMRWFDRAIAGHFTKRPQPSPFEVETIAETPQGMARPDGSAGEAASAAPGAAVPATADGAAPVAAVILPEPGDRDDEELGDEGPTLIKQEDKSKGLLRRITAGLRKSTRTTRHQQPRERLATEPTRQAMMSPAVEPALPVADGMAGSAPPTDGTASPLTPGGGGGGAEPVGIPEATTVRRQRQRPAAGPAGPSGPPPGVVAPPSPPPGVVAPPDSAVPPIPAESAAEGSAGASIGPGPATAVGAGQPGGGIAAEAERLANKAAEAAEAARHAAATADAASRAAALAGEALMLAAAGQHAEAQQRMEQALRLEPELTTESGRLGRRGVWPRGGQAAGPFGASWLGQWYAKAVGLLSKEGVALVGVLVFGLVLIVLLWALLRG